VIYIAFSSEMSGCYSTAVMAAGELREEFAERKCAVVDSKGGSGATGLIVLQALKLVRQGLPFDDVLKEIGFMAAHIEHVFSVDSLEWLAKGGRIPKIVGVIGGKLDVHPLLHVVSGRMAVLKMILGRRRTIQAVADEIVRRAGSFQDQMIAITHSDDLPTARLLDNLIRSRLPGCVTTLCHIGGVIAVHIGLRGIGAFCMNARPAHYSLT
jgi:DegV family protein with EDD domain